MGKSIRTIGRFRLGTSLLWGLGAGVALSSAGCGEPPPALRVDGVRFADEALVGIPAERQLRLAELTALGIAVAREDLSELGAPLLERRFEDLVLERFRAALALEAEGVGEDALRAHYETNPRLELVVRHVVALAESTAPEEELEEARARARTALERIEGEEPFDEVAADLSEEPGAAERGGLLRPGREGSWVPEFWDAARALEPGEVSDVVRTPYGFHVLRLEERRIVAFEEVRSEVALEAARLLGGIQEAWEAWTEEVGARIEVDGEALAAWRSCPTPDDRILARGPEGPLRAGAMDRAAATRSPREVEALRTDPTAAEAAVVGELVRAAALKRARRREIDPPPGSEDRLGREWEAQALGWAPGLPVGRVGERALAALSSTGQNARIAREEVAVRGPLLRIAYPIEGVELPGSNPEGPGCDPVPAGA